MMTALLGLAMLVQNAAAPSQKDIDDAVKKGLEYLKTAPSPGGHLKDETCDELILLTLIHGGMSEGNPVFKKYLASVEEAPLKHTYKVALKAMCLEELDPAKYQVKIAQCAQFLIDNQAANGQWGYGRPTDLSKIVEDNTVRSGGGREDRKPERRGVVNFGAERRKSVPKSWLAVQQQRTTGEAGDNSNSQYAALGLRACHDAKIRLPEAVLHLARRWWVEAQHPADDGAGKDAVSSGGAARPQGWNYKSHTNDERKPYHAMTAGAVGATVIYEYMLGRDHRKDKVTNAGVAWIGKHFAVNTNYYYMYALERAGMLYDVESFDGNNWYWKGVPVLLKNQNADGSWGTREDKAENTWDTCFAILFLKKATKGVITGK